MKAIIVERSDDLWRFACGDVYPHCQNHRCGSDGIILVLGNFHCWISQNRDSCSGIFQHKLFEFERASCSFLITSTDGSWWWWINAGDHLGRMMMMMMRTYLIFVLFGTPPYFLADKKYAKKVRKFATKIALRQNNVNFWLAYLFFSRHN